MFISYGFANLLTYNTYNIWTTWEEITTFLIVTKYYKLLQALLH